MKKNRKMIIFVSCIFLVLIIILFTLMNNTVKKAESIAGITPGLTCISDGEYIGEYSIAPVHVNVKVNVAVTNHEIVNIEILEHDNGLGRSAESIINNIVNTQSLEIDTISGATVSSKCILKAVENAID